MPNAIEQKQYITIIIINYITNLYIYIYIWGDDLERERERN